MLTEEKFKIKLRNTTTDTQVIFVCQDGAMVVTLHYDSQNLLHGSYFFTIDRLGVVQYKILNEATNILAMYDYITTNNCSQQVVVKHKGKMQVNNIIEALQNTKNILELENIYKVLNISNFSENDFDFIELTYYEEQKEFDERGER